MNTTVTTTPAKTPETKLSLRQHLEGPAFVEAVRKALPTHLKPDRFIRVALTALTKTPKLAQCDQSSFFSCLLSLSQFGLEPDGRRAHLIPYENRKRGVVECQLIIDWKGLVELAMRSGIVANLHADVVRDGDLFDYSCGKIRAHVPWFIRRDTGRPDKAGDVFAVYATAEFKDGSSKAELLSKAEVDAIRARSRSGQVGPWATDWSEMAKKTAFRRLSKWLPLSSEFRDAIEVDDELSGVKQVVPLEERVSGGLAAMLDNGVSTDAALIEVASEDVPYTNDAQPTPTTETKV